MGFGLGIALLASGTAFGGGAVILYYHLVEMATERLQKQNEKLQRECFDYYCGWQCDRAYRKGYREGRENPLNDVERLARTFEGHRVKVGRTVETAKKGA